MLCKWYAKLASQRWVTQKTRWCRAPSRAVTLELFSHDPLLSVHLGMWTQNPAGMAMLFAGLELMEKEVDSN